MADESSAHSLSNPTPSVPDTIDNEPASDLPWPPRLGPRYRPRQLHARGGLGEVHVANDMELGRIVALKLIRGNFDIELVKGFSNILFGGEGLFFATLRGPGRVWLQTMPTQALAKAIMPYLPKPSSS